jgi:Fur family transcriptional regulator, ferric uptake regulator
VRTSLIIILAIVVEMRRAETGRELAVRLTDARVRPTRQRLLVIETLAAEPDDATAQEVHARLRNRGERIGLATVYRTLSLLTERHVVDELSHQAGESCYRLCSPGHHHHLVCTSCHRVEELQECAIDRWLDSASRSRGFRPTSHTLEVSGVCADCREPARA